MQLAALLEFHTWLTQVGCPTPAVTVSRGVGVVLVRMSCYPLVFLLVLAQLPLPLLPLRGSAPFTGELACLTPVCRSPPGVWLVGTCCVLFLRACGVRYFPCCWFPAGFQVNEGLYFCFPGVVGWASAFSLLFLGSPAPLPCWGGWTFAPCVRVLQFRCVLLGLQVRSPCCLSLTLVWVCFWPKVSQVFVGCEGGLSCPSWFVVLFLCLLVLLFWGWDGLVTGRWPLLRLLVLDSSDARLHRPDALASDCYATTISGRWVVLPPALSWALPWVLPSRFQCWLLA